MSRTTFSALAAVALLAACGPKAPDAATDPNANKMMDAAPKVPRVTMVEAGKAVDAMGMISGGVMTTFTPTDTINVSVGTENVGLGAKIQIRLVMDTMKLVTVEAAAPAPDSTGKAMVALKVVSPKPLKLGHYQLQALIDTMPQMAKEIEITKNGMAAPEKPAAAPEKPAAKGEAMKPAAKGGSMSKGAPKKGGN